MRVLNIETEQHKNSVPQSHSHENQKSHPHGKLDPLSRFLRSHKSYVASWLDRLSHDVRGPHSRETSKKDWSKFIIRDKRPSYAPAPTPQNGPSITRPPQVPRPLSSPYAMSFASRGMPRCGPPLVSSPPGSFAVSPFSPPISSRYDSVTSALYQPECEADMNLPSLSSHREYGRGHAGNDDQESQSESGSGDVRRCTKRRKLSENKPSNDRRLLFACPFFQHDPSKYGTWRSCPGPGWPSTNRLKYARSTTPNHLV